MQINRKPVIVSVPYMRQIRKMISAKLILPHQSLQEYVNSYTICSSDSAKINIGFPLFARHETTIGFFLGDTSIKTIHHQTRNTSVNSARVFLFGLSARCIESMASLGDYNTFTIEFKPNGFNKLFGIPAVEITDHILPANEVIGNGIILLYQQLLQSKQASQMGILADQYLINVISRAKKKYTNEGVTKASSHLFSNTTSKPISHYANLANMSLRNFERRFVEQVGTTPKIYCRLLRFNSALTYKINNPHINWETVSELFSYYDNMHLIKDFKTFTNSSPAKILQENPGFLNTGCYKVHTAN